MEKIDIDAGVAGEYYVAAELTRRGYIACLTSKNTKTIDILASNKTGLKSVSIQVKTRKKAKDFALNVKDELLEDNDNLFYIFVNLNISNKKGVLSYGEVEYYVVPMMKVKNFIYNGHREWLKTPRKDGELHPDTNIRKYKLQEDDKLNNFEILGLDY